MKTGIMIHILQKERKNVLDKRFSVFYGLSAVS